MRRYPSCISLAELHCNPCSDILTNMIFMYVLGRLRTLYPLKYRRKLISEEYSNVFDGGRLMHVAWSCWSWGSSFSTLVLYVGVSFTPLFIYFEEVRPFKCTQAVFFIFEDPQSGIQKHPFLLENRNPDADATGSDSTWGI